MATQYATDIPFSSSHAQQAFKLLELPPELLALLESDDPPTFTISSSSSSSSSNTSSQTPAVLSFDKSRYQLRQKSTSNPILILAPSSTGPTDAETETRTDGVETSIPQPSITTVAKIEDTIELILLPPEEGVAEGERAKAAPKKVNKWHEKFAAGRVKKK